MRKCTVTKDVLFLEEKEVQTDRGGGREREKKRTNE